MDKIADLITIIRNGIANNVQSVSAPSSNFKVEILKVLKKEGYIENFQVLNEDLVKKTVKITLKYDKYGKSPIHSLKKISKLSKRSYTRKSKIPKTMNGFGINIISTSKGVMSGKEARLANLGGENLIEVW